jgi:spore germination protein YaaH
VSISYWVATVSAALAVVGGLWPAHLGLGDPQAVRPNGGLVLGYYVPYDPTSWASLEAHASQVDVVAGQWVTIDPCGGLTTRDDQSLKQFAQGRGLLVEPSLYTASGWLDHRVLTDDATRWAALQNVVAYTTDEGYDGFDLDLEGVDPGDREPLTDFVTELGAALHANGKLLTLALPAKERDVTTGWSGAFDYAALGERADLVTIMAYEDRGPFSGPGSVAPYAWVANVATFAGQQIARDKVLLGLAFYGYDWNTTSGGALSLGFPRAMTLAERVQAVPGFDSDQRSLTFRYTSASGDAIPAGPTAARPNHVITTRTSVPCDVAPPNAASPTPGPPAPAPDTPQSHEVWIEDSQSAAARIELAERQHLRGVAAWRLGFEDPNVWPLLDQWRQLRGSGQ